LKIKNSVAQLMPIIDDHTHAQTRRWLEMLREQESEFGLSWPKS